MTSVRLELAIKIGERGLPLSKLTSAEKVLAIGMSKEGFLSTLYMKESGEVGYQVSKKSRAIVKGKPCGSTDRVGVHARDESLMQSGMFKYS